MAVQVKGLLETTRKLEQVVADLHGEPLLSAFREAAVLVQNDAKVLAPVDTGRLRASITPEVRTEGKKVMGVVGSNVVYAAAMELGTGTFAGQGRHWPPAKALDVWARRHGLANGYVVARAIGLRGGLRPRRYLQQAFEQNRARIQDLIEGAVSDIVDK